MTAARSRTAKIVMKRPPLVPLDEPFVPGPAATARGSAIVALEGERRSSTRSEPVYVRRYECECVVDAYSTRGQITDRQWRAGILFRSRWHMLARKGRVTASYGLTRGTVLQGDDAEIRWEDNRRLLAKTLDDLGPLLSALVISVCGENEFAGADSMRTLGLALTWLADAWRIDKAYCRDTKRH